jgi:hypothetical protein
MVVSLTNAVNNPIKLTNPSVGVVNWRSMGSGRGFHYVCTPFELLQARTSPLADISHIKPGVSKEPTILDVDDCTDAPERCQTRYRA